MPAFRYWHLDCGLPVLNVVCDFDWLLKLDDQIGFAELPARSELGQRRQLVGRAFLQAAGCDEYQGFLFAPALDSLSFEQRQAQARGLPPPGPPPAPRMRLVRQ